MRVLGIDPGIGRMGFAIVEQTKDQNIAILESGCFTTASTQPKQERLSAIANFIREIVTTWSPDKVAVEKLFFAKNTKTAMDVAEARGVILQTISASKRALVEFTPLQVKMGVTGNGRATKQQVFKTLGLILKRQQIPTQDDTVDAIAIALCALYYKDFQKLSTHS